MLLAHGEQNAWPHDVTKKSDPSNPNSTPQFGVLHCILAPNRHFGFDHN
jgi:hypothetical protein